MNICIRVFVFFLTFFYSASFSQTTNQFVSFFDIKNDTLMREVAHFNKKNKIIKNTIKVNQFTPKICSDTLVYFRKGNIFMTDFSIYLRLNKNIDNSNDSCYDSTSIQSAITIRFNPGPHSKWIIPEKFTRGIFHPSLCGKDKKKIMVFSSLDRKRIYIYTVLENASSEYEVTWVINGYNDYITIIDKIR